MNYFVTGATGFIGGRLVRQLLEQGHEVRAIVRNPAKAQDLQTLGIRLFQGDITNKESMREAMTGVDGVFHLAAWYKLGQKDASMAYDINVTGTRNVLELAKELEVPKIAYTSTLAVFGDTHGKLADESYFFDPAKEAFISDYDRSKWQAHYEVAVPMMQAGLPLVIVQPGLVYGPGDTSSIHDTFVQYLQKKLPLVPQRSAFAWGHVDDIAAGHLLAIEKGKLGESYIIAGPVHTLLEALELSQKLSGVALPRFQPKPGFLKGLAVVMQGINKLIPLPPLYHPETLRAAAGVTYIGGNSKAKRELGFEPRPLKEGLKEMLDHEMQTLGMLPPSKHGHVLT